MSGETEKGPRQQIFYFGPDGDLNAVRRNDWKVHFARLEGNISDMERVVTGWPTSVNLRADPYEEM